MMEVLLLLMAVIWAVNFSVIKYGLLFISPLAFNGVRIPLAAAAQLGVGRAMRLDRPSPKDAMRLVVLGMFGNGLYQVLFILGVALTRVATAALVIAATPAFIALLGRYFGSETMSRRNWAGIGCQIVGCSTVVIGSTRGGEGRDTVLGAILILMAAFTWAVYTVALKKYSHRVHPVQLGGYTMLGGSLVMGVVAVPSMLGTEWTALPVGVYLAILYSAIVAMVVAYLIWYRGLRVLGPTRTAVYSNLQPLIAGIVAWIALGEVPTIPQVMGASLIISGLLLTRS